MADHTDNAMRAAIRALDEVIYDAIDPIILWRMNKPSLFRSICS